MTYSSQSILFKRISTLFSLIILVILTAVVRAVIIHKAQKLAEPQKPLPILVSPHSITE